MSSIEQFDKSSASWNVPLQRDWRIINHVLNSPRYEMAVASIPVSQIGVIIDRHVFKIVNVRAKIAFHWLFYSELSNARIGSNISVLLGVQL